MEPLLDFHWVDELTFDFAGLRINQLKDLQKGIVDRCRLYGTSKKMSFEEWFDTFIAMHRIKWILFDRHLGLIEGNDEDDDPIITPHSIVDIGDILPIAWSHRGLGQNVFADFRVDTVLPPPFYNKDIDNQVILVGEASDILDEHAFLEREMSRDRTF